MHQQAHISAHRYTNTCATWAKASGTKRGTTAISNTPSTSRQPLSLFTCHSCFACAANKPNKPYTPHEPHKQTGHTDKGLLDVTEALELGLRQDLLGAVARRLHGREDVLTWMLECCAEV